MTTPLLHYIYDPLCGWCYGASPLIEAVSRAALEIRLHGGGLFAMPTRVGPDKAAYMRSADARIAGLTGQRFGDSYFGRLLDDPATAFWSVPPIAAVLAADQISAGSGPAMLAAIQKAHYVDGRRVAERVTLAAIASDIGLDNGAFDLAFSMDTAGEHIAQTHRLMRSWSLQGYPGFVLDVGGRLTMLAHEPFYGRPAEFADMVTRTVRPPDPG